MIKEKISWLDYSLMFVFAGMLCLILILVSYFGCPFTDESFPIATALRFLHQRPFIDDLSPYISNGLLLYPLIKLSLYIHHGKNELILFFRHAFIVFLMILGTYSFFSIKKFLPYILAFFITTFMIMFHPFGLNNFHYDSLALFLWTIIIFQLFCFLYLKKNNLKDYILFVLFSVMLVFSYPTFIFILFPIYFLFSFFLENKKLFLLSILYSSLVISIFLGWLIFLYYDVEKVDIINTLKFCKDLLETSAVHANVFQKLSSVLGKLLIIYKNFLIITFFLSITAFFLRNKNRVIVPLALFAIFLSPLCFINIEKATYMEAFFFLNCLGFGGMILFLFFNQNNLLTKKLFYYVGLPSLYAGLVTSASSYNREVNFIIGFFPGTILSFIFAYFILETYIKTELFKKLLGRGLLIYGYFSIAFFQLNYIYGADDPGLNVYLHKHKFSEKGPFKGLYFNRFWLKNLSELQKDIERIDHNSNVFIYFGVFSSGYLLINYLRPGDYILYCPYTSKHFGRNIRKPNYTIDMTRSFFTPAKEIDAHLAGNSFSVIKKRRFFDIYYMN